MRHIIRKQTIQLQLSRKADAFEMQHLMSSHYWRSVVPALEKLFDEVCPEGETICIDKIEINLGTLTYKEMYCQQWSETLLSEIATQFYEKLSAGAAGSKATIQLQPSQQGMVQQWLYYMVHGYLPWNTLQINEDWKQQVLEALAKEKESIHTLRKLLLTDSSIVSRITTQHKTDFLLQFTEILASAKLPRLPLLLQELELVLQQLAYHPASPPTLPKTGISSQRWSHVLRFSAAHKQASDEKAIVLHILDNFMPQPLNLQNVFQNLSVQPAQLMPLVKEWIAGKSTTTKEKADPAPVELHPANPPRETVLETSDNEAETEEALIDEEGIFVQHAGLVLLHPFLSTFFSRLQLTKLGNFKNLAAKQKALYLLHYLATGELSAEEYELVVPKVLCAYPLQKPIPHTMNITPEEIEEADALLHEVIHQWEVLKSTTPAGLREEFLKRNGKLISKKDKLHLLVETNAIDVLLDFLPWNLSLIKLPWMKELLHVEWR